MRKSITRNLGLLLAVAAAIWLVWFAIESQSEVLLCRTETYGVRIELHRNPILKQQKAIVLMDPAADLPEGVAPRLEIDTREEADMLGIALAAPRSRPIDIFSDAFRESNCEPLPTDP